MDAPGDAPDDAVCFKSFGAPDFLPCDGSLDRDEGGEVRLEHVRFAGGNAATRATAFFYKNSGSVKFFPWPDLNGCTDTSRKVTWPTASNPIGERAYLDPGQVLIAGGPQVLSVEGGALGADFGGRVHPADRWRFHFQGTTGTDGPTYVSEKTQYDVVITGSPDMPAQIFDDVIFVPADFPLTTPGVAPFPLPAATPQTFTWTPAASSSPQGYEVQAMVAFTGPDGPAVMCIEKDDGSITVPAAMIDIVRAKYPTGGTLVRQTSTHVIRELVDATGPTRKRIDFIGAWAYETAFTVP
jgi:hypothetical protein